ncbi:DUF6583 family protein [Aureibacillus halotolerans]|uniref:Uncharacterized protein n=1 Tax=Aureibacillus halotolerans TaxID=1508390 RepID=A0A4R6U875_9BACI|nr:DUF6583 family protein [Aureibacillus halotolerans]TDQ42581.1 hypothetical protein EV213_1019 [Aureibacillus halotolerans]
MFSKKDTGTATKDLRSKTSQRVQSEIAASVEPGATTSSKKPKIWMIVAAVVVVILAVSAIVFANQSKDNPKNAFFKAESAALQEMKDSFDESSGEAWDFQNRLLEEPSKSTLDISASVKGTGEMANDPTFQMLKPILDSSSLSITSGQNYDTEEMYAILDVIVGGTPFLSGEVSQTTEALGIKLPQFYQDYLYVPNDQFGDFARRIDPAYAGPDTVNLMTYFAMDYKALLPTEEEWDHLMTAYGKDYFYENISEEQFTAEDNQPFEQGDVSMDLRNITLQLEPEEVRTLIAGYLEKIKSDETVKSMVERQVTALNESMAQQAQLDPTMAGATINIEEMLSNWETSLDDAIAEVNDRELVLPSLTYTIKVDQDNNIIARNVNFEGEGTMTVVTQDVPTGDDTTSKVFDLQIKPADEASIGLRAETDVSKTEAGQQEVTKVLFNDESTEYTFDIKAIYGEGEEATDSYTLTFNDPNTNTPIIVTMDVASTIDNDAGTANDKIDLSLQADSIAPGMTFGLDLDSSIEITEDIGLPDPSQGTNLAELSDQELQQLMMELQTNASTFMQQFMGGFGAGF